MSPQMIEAVRKEAFVQGWMRRHAVEIGSTMSAIPDHELLRLLPIAYEAYRSYRAERGHV